MDSRGDTSGGEVFFFLPARNEAATVGSVISEVPATVYGHPVRCAVVDDGSDDDTAVLAEVAGAVVFRLGQPMGLGAAVRRGLKEAVAIRAATVAFCDADAEYRPEELARLVEPILADEADYVVGSRFAGRIDRMRPHRRLGNKILTFLLRWISGTPITDGQSGYRALSLEAARCVEIEHDYNYAQVLTLDLINKRFRYLEVPISYRSREHGRSFVRLTTYLRHVVPAVVRVQHRHARLRRHPKVDGSASPSPAQIPVNEAPN